MAEARFATDNKLAKKLFDEQLFRQGIAEAYWTRFKGNTPSSAVWAKQNFKKDKGDSITFGLIMKGKGAGQVDGLIEGNEEDVTTYDCSVLLHSYSHGFKYRASIEAQRAMFEMDVEAQTLMKNWITEKVDNLHFEAITAAPTKIIYKTSAGIVSGTVVATVLAALTVADSKLTPAMLSAAKTNALTGGGDTYVPLQPIKVDGKEYLVYCCHPDALYDLKQDTTFSQAIREAEVRGKENPLFTGSAAIWDGVVIHTHRRVPYGKTGSVPWQKGFMFGAQSLLLAEGKRGEIVMETKSYKQVVGYGSDQILGVVKPKFNSQDFGSIAIYTARTDVAAL